jgi:multiple sugar transport system permease protein
MRLGPLVVLVLACLGAAQQPVTIRYACSDNTETISVTKGVVAEFEKAHPKIRVKIEPIVSDYAQKLMTMVAGRVAPDVARMGPVDFQPLAARGALVALDDLVARDQFDLGQYYPNAVGLFRYEQKLYCLPRSLSPTGILYYNKRLLDEAGIPYPDGSWTWSLGIRPDLKEKDFFYVVDHLTKRKGKRVEQYGLGVAWPQLWFNTLLLSRGLTLWDSNQRPSRIDALRPEVVELMEFASATMNKHEWIPTQLALTTNNTSVRDQFVQGKIALFQSGPWEIRKFRREVKDDWDICLFPAYENEPYRCFGEGNGIGVFASTKHQDEAWEFAKWMAGPQGQIAFAKAGLDQPCIANLAVAPGIWLPDQNGSVQEKRPEHAFITDSAARGMTVNQVPEWFRPIADASQGIAFDILSGLKPPRQTLERYQRDATRDLELAQRRLKTEPYPVVPAVLIAALMALGAIFWIYRPERGVIYNSNERRDNRSAYLFLVPWFLGLALTFGPMVYSFFLSFAQSDMIQAPRWVGLQNYSDAIKIDDSVPISIRQTFVFALFSIPLGMVSALGLALLLNQKVKGVPLFRALFYLPSLASGVAMSLIWMRIFNPKEGLLNQIIYGPDGNRNLLGLGGFLSRIAGKPDQPVDWLNSTSTVIPAFVIMGLWGAGAGTIIYLAGLQAISPSYHEAATIDGAGIWKRFRNVTLPLLTPTIFFSLITGVIGTLQVFTQAVVMTDGGPDRATLFYMVNLYRAAFNQLRMGYASALAWILFVIILAITLVQLRASKRWVFYEGEMK